MMKCFMDARTVSIAKEYSVTSRHGVNGAFEAKSIMIRVAVDRDYRVTKVENGVQSSVYPTDFFVAKATGAVAETLARYCTAKRADGKLISRHLLLVGTFETYKKDVVAKNATMNTAMGQITGEAVLPNYTQTIFVIESFKFLDKNPIPQADNTGVYGYPSAPAYGMNPYGAAAMPPMQNAQYQLMGAPMQMQYQAQPQFVPQMQQQSMVAYSQNVSMPQVAQRQQQSEQQEQTQNVPQAGGGGR